MSDIIIILLCLLFSAFFSGMEIAFISSNRLKIELDKKKGLFSSRIIGIFLKNPGHFIASMLVGNNIALVVYGILVARLLGPFITNSLLIHNEVIILILQTLAGTLVILFTAEFLPKTLFKINPNTSLNVFAIPTFAIYILLYPVTLVTIGITNFIMKHILRVGVKVRKVTTKPVFGKVDLDHLVAQSKSDIEKIMENEPEKKIFQNALEFSSLKVRDCMVPRTEVEAIEINSSMEELRKKFIETGYSKILVYDGSVDNMTGYIGSKELFQQPKSIRSKLVNLTIVPETMQVNKLFKKLIRERKSIALVVDEFGGTSGIITLEDIIEEIFGEIEDEHDTVDFTARQINENEFVFSGRVEVDYINEMYNLDIPVSDEYETLAGYIIEHCENIPKLNTRIIIGKYQFRMLIVSQTKIELIQIKKMVQE